MTKKHFLALANVLIQNKPWSPNLCGLGVDYGLGAWREWESIREALADFCQSQNAQFDRNRWLAYIANGGAK